MSSIRKVARTCQVSPMTVSLVLNNPDTGRVSPETRTRVLRVVRELGYRPKPRSVESESFKTIGLVANPDAGMFSGDHYLGRVLEGILRQPDSRRHNMMMFAPELFAQKDVHRAVRSFCDGKCDGLIIVAPNKNSPLARALILRGLPLVIIGTSELFDDIGDVLAPAVIDVDNHRVGREATEYLLAHGHRRIAFVGGPEFVVSTWQRLAGYREAMAAAGLAIDPRLVRMHVPKTYHPHHMVAEWLSLPKSERPTAIFAWNDGSAMETRAALRQHGVRLPEEMSLIGIDDNSDAATGDPPLTSFRQPFDRIGALTLDALHRQFEMSPGDEEPNDRHLLPATIVVRDSVAPCPDVEAVRAGVDCASPT
ncbi:MAG: LacI family DNA-binding transcriptional regulator [Capsulimonadales bacterium]|nr:LacI family DNA-binding transcriptional regulator [Capsulimonadales bacterium]